MKTWADSGGYSQCDKNQRTLTFDLAFKLITASYNAQAQHVHQHEAISWKQLQEATLPWPPTFRSSYGTEPTQKEEEHGMGGGKAESTAQPAAAPGIRREF